MGIVSPSWGGPSLYPHIYEAGLEALHDIFGLKVKEYPTARMDAKELYKNPERRARDLNDAFADGEVRAIITTIGGDDSVRILPFLDLNVALRNPKILMGFSDATTLLTLYNQAGLVTFHGPSVMAGLAQLHNASKRFQTHVEDLLFGKFSAYDYRPYDDWYEGYPDWKDPVNSGKTNPTYPHDGWRWLQGQGRVNGRLFGGCIEVLEFLKGTDFWPAREFWNGKILFLETSEDKPLPVQVQWMVRNYGMQGVFERITGLLIGRARGYTIEQKQELDERVLCVIADEFGATTLIVISNMDFGHTDPQLILPLGIEVELDCNRKTFRLMESPTV